MTKLLTKYRCTIQINFVVPKKFLKIVLKQLHFILHSCYINNKRNSMKEIEKKSFPYVYCLYYDVSFLFKKIFFIFKIKMI